jgi:PAS domain S-box-containing protein
MKDARTREALGQVYEATFRDHPSSMCVLRMHDLTFVAANPAFERAVGRSLGDLLGRRPDEIGLIDATDAATVLREVAALDERDARDLVTRIHYRLPDGRAAVARMAVGLTELNGEPHLIASFTDASAAVRQELALGRRNAILETIGAAAQLFYRPTVGRTRSMRSCDGSGRERRCRVRTCSRTWCCRAVSADRPIASSGAHRAWSLRSGTPRRSTKPSIPPRTNGAQRSAAASPGW